ncbi:MAG: trypsin-like peptidase domain-containing protein [Burkholderiaceae bacterium]|nr:trypsin-like peptidase domain-containing protein [Burkholderiaceae bacterium]
MLPLTRFASTMAGQKRKHAAASVRSVRCARLMLGWLQASRWRAALNETATAVLAEPPEKRAIRILARRHENLIERGKRLAQASPGERPQVRIAAKKSRYATEFFQSLHPAGRVDRYLRCLAALQDELGWLNDAAVADRSLREIETSRPGLAGSASFARGFPCAATKQAPLGLARLWKQFRLMEPTWAGVTSAQPWHERPAAAGAALVRVVACSQCAPLSRSYDQPENSQWRFRMKPLMRISRTALIAMAALVVAGTGWAFSLDPSTWFSRTSPAASAASPTGVGAPVPPPPLPAGVTPNYRAIVQQAGPAVVGVTVAGRHRASRDELPPGLDDDPFFQFFRGLPGFPGRFPQGDVPFKGQGSGFIISSDGLILTNAHVVRDAKEVTVKLSDRREFKAKVLGADGTTDVAVLRIDETNLPVVRLGNVQQLEVGDPVLAIGSPFGFDQTATQGIVSAKGRSLPGDSAVPFIQTDAAVNPGNSGGPLFDGSGAVVGINAQIYSRSGGFQGLSFAIPINVALKVKDQILAKGRASHARLGVTVQDLNQALADAFGLNRPGGALIASVMPGSAAAAAGLRPGDVVNLRVWRDKGSIEIKAKLGQAEDEAPSTTRPAPEPQPGQLGLRVRPLTSDERAESGLDSGLFIEGVAGPTERAGVQPGDVLLAVNGVRVNSPEQLRGLIARKPKSVALLIDRGGERLYVPVDLG